MGDHHQYHHRHRNQQQKLLLELLQDEQEPFLLHNYIAHHRHLARTRPKQSFAKHACFFSSNNSPAAADRRKSPLYLPKSPLQKGPNSGGRTASSLLLEVALRVSQKTQSSSSRGGTPSKFGCGIFGSLLMRLGSNKNSISKNDKISSGGFDGAKVSVKDILTRDGSIGGSGRRRKRRSKSASPATGTCESGSSSAVWSSESNQSNLQTVLDLDCRSSSSDGDAAAGLSEEEIQYDVNQVTDEKQYCESPFHFALERSLSSSSSSGRRTPDFPSPVASPPTRPKAEGNEDKKDVESLNKCQVQKQAEDGEEEEEEEEEKEQCSPVSVLDPPFDDEDCGEDDDEDEGDEEREDDGFDMECSFAFVQKAKQQLLLKLRRFEKLAELDPVELEKRMLEYDDEEDDEEEEDGDSESQSNCIIDELIMGELLSESSFQCPTRDMKRLVSDLIDEEQGNIREGAAKRVCKRFESWKEVESDTVDMMVEDDFNGSQDEWRQKRDQVSDIAREIELAIFGILAEELI